MSEGLEKHKALVERLSWKLYRQALSWRCHNLDFEDIKQEVWHCVLIAEERFDASLGIPFGAYLTRGAKQHLRRLIGKEMKRNSLTPMSLDQTIQHDDGETNLHELLSLKDNIPEELIADEKISRAVKRRLSETSRKFVELLDNPTPAMYQELAALQARATFGREQGLNTRAPKNITSKMVFDIMGLSASERRKVLAEIEKTRKIYDA